LFAPNCTMCGAPAALPSLPVMCPSLRALASPVGEKPTRPHAIAPTASITAHCTSRVYVEGPTAWSVLDPADAGPRGAAAIGRSSRPRISVHDDLHNCRDPASVKHNCAADAALDAPTHDAPTAIRDATIGGD
jgi:hypothetical protein